jgi:hypothetical protein
MAWSFVDGGELDGSATVVTVASEAPAGVALGDILIAFFINKSVTANAVTPPAGWVTPAIINDQNDCTTAADRHQFTIFYKIAVADDVTISVAEGTYTFTKAVDDNVLFGGVICAWRSDAGTITIDATAPVATKTVGATDNVSFPAFDPTSTNTHVIYAAFYGNDVTTPAADMSADTNPDCTIRFENETSIGTDCTIAICSGDSDGSSIASRTWAMNATTDAGNSGVVFAISIADGGAPAEQQKFMLLGVG